MKTCVRMQGVNGCFRGCMEATVREPPRCFAVFELQPPWGDRTNHGGGWVVGETHVRGEYSRHAVHGTPRAASLLQVQDGACRPSQGLAARWDCVGLHLRSDRATACWCKRLWIRKPGGCISPARHLFAVQLLLTEATGLQRLCLDFPDIAVGLGGFIAAVSGISIV